MPTDSENSYEKLLLCIGISLGVLGDTAVQLRLKIAVLKGKIPRVWLVALRQHLDKALEGTGDDDAQVL